MKTSNNIITVLSFAVCILIICIFSLGSKIQRLEKQISDQPKISLPEEYKAITAEDKLYGWYYNDTLHIAFDNQEAYSNIQ